MVLHSWGFHVAELPHDTVGALWTKPCGEMVCFVLYHVLLIYWIALFHSSLNVADGMVWGVRRAGAPCCVYVAAGYFVVRFLEEAHGSINVLLGCPAFTFIHL